MALFLNEIPLTFEVVVLGCLIIYGLPDVWHSFNVETYPRIAPWAIPIVQVLSKESKACVQFDLLCI